MFAHQVIEDFENIKIKEQHPYTKLHHDLIPFIKKAHHIHINDADGLIVLKKSQIGKESLFVDNKQYIKLPYPVTYIDYETPDAESVSKVAQLAMQNDNTILVYHMNFIRKMKGWFLHPIFYNIEIGRGIKAAQLINLETGEQDKIVHEDQGDLSILHILLLLLNCKNVTIEVNKPDEALNKSRRKRGKQELFTYKTLKLLLPSSKDKNQLESTPTGEHNRIHFCRGHFKEYTAEHPLFGKYTGLWWWQPAVRGQNKDGIVMKDYIINTKHEEAQNGIN